VKASLATLMAYGFRPFFLLAALHAVGTTLAWALMLAGYLPTAAGNAVGWHAFEMIFGFVGAGLAGFLLTAVPSFTGSQPITGRLLMAMVLLWLGARGAAWLIGVFGLLPTVVLNLAFLIALIGLVAGPLLSDRHGRHRIFFYLLLALLGCQSLALSAWVGWLDMAPMRSLNLSVAVLMLLIIAAASRVSMQIVNDALAARNEERRYLARPPRRNLAMSLIAAFALVEFAAGPDSITGWLALAAAAAVLNLLNDWHLGRVLTDTYVAVLYGAYWLMALGLALIGIDYLFGGIGAANARHLITAGTVGLAMAAVLTIAGQRHTGRLDLDCRWPIRLVFVCIAAGAVLRAFVPVAWPAGLMAFGYSASSLLWATGFGLYLVLFWPLLTRPRVDGLPG